MQIGLTFDLQEAQAPDSGARPDAYAEFDTEESIGYLEAALRDLGHDARRIGDLRALMDFLRGGERVDLVFNMAEGRGSRSREAHVPALLEAYAIPYTGSDPLTLSLCLDKAATKRLWQWAGLPTPAFVVADDVTILAGNGLPPYPLFVKPLHEGTSKGINGASIVTSPEALAERVAWIAATYRQPALIEPFLSGREFSVGILGTGARARVIGVTEICPRAASGVADFHEKQRWDSAITGVFAPLPASPLREQLTALALQAYRVLECRDLGRVDLRLDADGAPQLLELNPIVGLYPHSSIMPILARQAGMSFNALVAAIVAEARARCGKE